MNYCKEYEKLSAERKFEVLESVTNELAKVNAVSYPNVYAQLTSSSSKRRVIQILVNAQLQQNSSVVDTLNALESNIETD